MVAIVANKYFINEYLFLKYAEFHIEILRHAEAVFEAFVVCYFPILHYLRNVWDFSAGEIIFGSAFSTSDINNVDLMIIYGNLK